MPRLLSALGCIVTLTTAGCSDQYGRANPAGYALGGAGLGALIGGGTGLIAQNQQRPRYYAPPSYFSPQYGYAPQYAPRPQYLPPVAYPTPYYGYGQGYAPPPGVRW